MNKYSLNIKWKFNEEFESWNMIIISDDSKEHVTEVMNTDGSGKIFIMILRLNFDEIIISAKERMRYMLWNNCLNM